MEFVPAGEIIGATHQVRTVGITASPQLPDGDYEFVDTYCIDPKCDCRKTMIHVLHNRTLVAIINYGWEPQAYYEKWMGGGVDDLSMPAMHGASIDISSPSRLSPEGVLGLFNALLNEKWIRLFKKHYRMVKARVKRKPAYK